MVEFRQPYQSRGEMMVSWTEGSSVCTWIQVDKYGRHFGEGTEKFCRCLFTGGID